MHHSNGSTIVRGLRDLPTVAAWRQDHLGKAGRDNDGDDDTPRPGDSAARSRSSRLQRQHQRSPSPTVLLLRIFFPAAAVQPDAQLFN